MKITAANLSLVGIGYNFKESIYPQDLETVVYGADLPENVVRENPETPDGEQAWWKEPSYDRWWKIGFKPVTKD